MNKSISSGAINAPKNGRDATHRASINTDRDAARHVSTKRPTTRGFIPLLWLFFLSVFVVQTAKAQEDYYFAGEGTPGEPFQINSVADLAQLATLVNAGDAPYNAANYMLMDDLDLDDDWTPIGNADNPFKGVFDGDNHEITGLRINATVAYQGLFGNVTGEVKNLGVIDASVTSTAGRTAILAGQVDAGGTIFNCFSSGTVSGNGSGVGGLIGTVQNAGCSVDKCYSTANVVNAKNPGVEEPTGGLIGALGGTGTALKNSYATGSVSGENLTGGLVGRLGDGADISACFATGNVSGSGDAAGGLIGMINNLAVCSVRNCYATGAVSGINRVGGIIGDTRGAVGTIIESCYATGAVSGLNRVGGIVGAALQAGLPGIDTELTNCIALNISVKAGSDAGRVIGSSTFVQLSNNAAWDGILNNLGNTNWGQGAHNNIQGATKTSSDVQLPSGFPAGFDDSPWTYVAGKLPGLNDETVDLPAHITAERVVDKSWYDAGVTTFTITTPEQLAGLAELVNEGTSTFSGKTVTLADNIDLSAYGQGVTDWNNGNGWTPIGVSLANSFQGVFDGGGNVISGLFINRTSDNQGLFGVVRSGTLTNIGVENASVNSGNGRNVGIVVGHLNGGSIDGCWSSGTVANTNGWIGGLVGLIDPDLPNKVYIADCYSSADVTCTGGDRVGGLVGFFRDDSNVLTGGNVGIMRNCYTTGTVNSQVERVGGILGNSVRLKISSCYSTATIISNAQMTGGIVGRPQNNTILENCYFTGTIAGTNNVGGIVGQLVADACSMTNCYATGKITGTSNVGGIAGDVQQASVVSNCAALNSSVEGTGTNVNRVVGNLGADCTLSGNVAFSGMLNNAGTTVWEGSGHDHKNGESKTARQIRAENFFETLFDDEEGNIWEFQSNMLPGLLGFSPPYPSYMAMQAETPVITAQPQGDYINVDEPYTLNVVVEEPTEGGVLNYQWYSNEEASNEDGTEIVGATGNEYEPDTEEEGTYHFYVVVTNTIADDGFGNPHSASVTSNVATLVVTPLPTYLVTIESDGDDPTGSGSYIEGATVNINAGTPPLGMAFKNWTSEPEVDFDDAESAVTFFEMPDEAVTVTALFEAAKYTATLTVNKDGAAWNAHSKNFILKFEDKEEPMTGDDATVTASVLNGEWNVYEGDIDTGATIKINNANGGATVNYYTINFSIVDTDPPSGATISATYDAHDITDGVVVLGGKELIVTVDVDDELYFVAWSGTASGALASYTTDVNAKLNAIATILLRATIGYTGIPDVAWHDAGEPFIIASADELAGLAKLVNDGAADFSGKTVTLANDIDVTVYGQSLSAEGWTPIGANNDNAFRGEFDGGGFVITGLFIHREAGNQGLFGVVRGGTLKNLGVENASIFAGKPAVGEIPSISGRNSGIVVGYLNGGSISDCWSSGSIENVSGWVGGLVGLIDADAPNKVYVENCHSSADVVCNGPDRAGGLLGFFRDDPPELLTGGNVGIMKNCYTTGTVTKKGGGDGRIGGIIGNSVRIKLISCYSTATIISDAEHTGGIIGRAQNNTILEDCYFTGTVAGTNNVGGIVGQLIADACSVTNCYATGAIAGTSNVGGIAGDVQQASVVSNCAALNISVKGTGTNVNRVVGNLSGSTLSDNVTFSGMLNNAGTTVWDGSGHDHRNGLNRTAAELQAASGFPTVFNATPWTYEAGKLPGLNGATVDMPEHLKSTTVAYMITLISDASDATGGGSYEEGVTVAINAGTPPADMQFKEWTAEPAVEFSDANSQSATFIMPANAVTITAHFEALPPLPSYAITVQTDGNGTASASATTAMAAQEITLTATPNSGYSFKEWEVVSGGVTIVNDKFTMPENDVTIKAIFEALTGVESLQVNPLKAYVNNGILHIVGLTEGKVWNLYSVSGALVKQGVADSDVVTVNLNLSGVFIIQSEGKTLKLSVEN